MKTHAKRIALCSGVLVIYFAAYFLSVTQPQWPTRTVAIYRPLDNGVIHVFFAPAHFVDASYLRQANWDPKLLR